MKNSDAGFEHMLTVIDACTRWEIIQALREISSSATARAAVDNWGKLGVRFNPRRFTLDGGAEFKGLVEDICTVLNLDRHVAVHDRPDGHDVIERFNREVCRLID